MGFETNNRIWKVEISSPGDTSKLEVAHEGLNAALGTARDFATGEVTFGSALAEDLVITISKEIWNG